MSLIGEVFNKAASKSIDVLIAESGEGFKRLSGAISQDVEDAALVKMKERFESGDLFKESDMEKMEKLVITNMSHTNPGDLSAHYPLQGETEAGEKIKGAHVPEDPAKQTVCVTVARNAELSDEECTGECSEECTESKA